MNVDIISFGNKETCLHVRLMFAKKSDGIRKILLTIVRHAAEGNPSVEFFMDIPDAKRWFDCLDAGEDALTSGYKVAKGGIRSFKVTFQADGKYRLRITNQKNGSQGKPMWFDLELAELKKLAAHGRDIIDHVERLWLTDEWQQAAD